MTETARDYRSTLNLPKTAFPMKANLAQAEPATLKAWEAAGQYEALMSAPRPLGQFVFHDGPPYANGSIHIGHLLNKVLKDFVVRTRLMAGHTCRYTPGWDCHGLPIEHRVMTEVLKGPKADKIAGLPDAQRRMAIRRECQAYAEKFIALQATQMKRLLTLADYANPYATMQPRYEAATLEVFAQMIEQGLVFRQLKPVHWSIANRTALADAELEYEEREDPAVWVEFESSDREAVEKAFGAELDVRPSFMIWTTTPWTLPANRAVAVHPRLRYGVVKLDGSTTIVAMPLLEKVRKDLGTESFNVIAEADGAALLGLKYRHPFLDLELPVVGAEYVTTEDGTGLVHTAPGHGEDDYLTGRREGLPIYCPVQGDGTFDDTAPEWLRGKTVWEGNPLVVEHLKQSGHLAHTINYRHSYPHDWRSKTPVIFRTTEQWFVGADRPTKRDGRTLRQAALSAVESSINFVPEWGRNRMRGMLESRPDWCISRQRSWGLPIPAFELPDGTVLLTAASVRAVSAQVRQRGSDIWFTETHEQVLSGYDPKADPDAPESLRSGAVAIGQLTQMADIFDVWFEAGSSWNSVLRERSLGYPAELYLEGSDQHRGWFQLSLLPALACTGQSPFKCLLTHGFIVDKDGKKMSKSLGNAIEVETLLKDYGADVCRWWVSSVAYDGDIKVDLEFFRLAGESYRKVRNTLRFLLSNLADFDARAATAAIDPASIDGWALAQLAALETEVRAAYTAYDFRRAHLAIFAACNETLSAIYCAATKDRLYCDRADSPRRRRTQAVMHRWVDALSRMLWPIMPHTAEETWRALHGENAAQLGAQTFLGVTATADEAWPELMRLREATLKALDTAKSQGGVENPLDAGAQLPAAAARFARFAEDLADLCGISRVSFDAAGEVVQITDLRNEPRCERSWRRDGTVSQRSDGGLLSGRDAAAVGV